MNACDFSRSFVRWTSATNNHTPRLQIAAACTLGDADGVRDYFLTDTCTGEQMYADEGLIHLPANEFAMIYGPGDQEYMFIKYYADDALNVVEAHRVGEAMTTHDGRGAPIVEMAADMVRHDRVHELKEYGEIREAILGNRRLNARTEYLGEDGDTRVVLDYPVRICNVAHGRERWQIDTGPILLPDLSLPREPRIGRLRSGYIVFNSPDRAEIIYRRATSSDAGLDGSHFSAGRGIEARNSIYCLD